MNPLLSRLSALVVLLLILSGMPRMSFAETPTPLDVLTPTVIPVEYPLTIDNCGLKITYEAAPQRAVTMNQAATEIMLALGLEDHMVGTAYLDDEILPELAEAYSKVPVLSDQYPSREILLAAQPDFVYGVYRSAFGSEAAGPREKLLELGIKSYLSAAGCPIGQGRPEKITFETLYSEIRDIGRIFGVPERAEALIGRIQARLDMVRNAIRGTAKPYRAFWYDSEIDKPYVGACCGMPAEIMNQIGLENIFADVEGSWASVNWEEVIARDADVVIVVEADWSPAQEKIDLLKNNPAYASLTAVKHDRFVVIPFSATTLGMRNAEGVEIVARELYPDVFTATTTIERTPTLVLTPTP